MVGIGQELRRVRASPLARNAGWMALGQGSGFLLQSAYFLLLARLLGAYDYGLFAGAFALTGILGQYSSLGSGTLFLRYATADPLQARLYWGNILAATTACSALMIAALSIWGSRWLGPGTHAIVLLAAVANCLCNQLSSAAARVFQAYEELRTAAILSLAINFARTLAAAWMLVALGRANAYQWSVATTAVSAVAAIAAVALVTARVGVPCFSLRQMRRDLLEGFEFSFASSTSSAYNDIDKTMLTHYGMAAANGVYTMAYRVIDVATIPVLAIREAAMPRFFRHGIGDSGSLATKLLKRAIPLAALAAVGVFALAPMVPHLAGKGFAQTASALRWLCLIPLLRSVHHMTGSAITGSGRQKYRTASQVLAAAFNFGVNLWLIPRFGWLGAAWSSLATDGLLAVANSVTLALLCRTHLGQTAAEPVLQ